MIEGKRKILWDTVSLIGGVEYISWAVLSRRAEMLEILGRWPEAEEVYAFLYEKAQALGWPEHLRFIWRRYGLLLFSRNRLEEAQEIFNQLYQFSEGVKDRQLKADAWTGFGVICWKQGRLPEAEECYRQAELLLEDSSHPERLSALYNNFGILYENMGQYQRAMEFYHKKMDIEKGRENLAGLSKLYNNLGICYMHMDDLNNAERCLKMRMEMVLRMGDIYGQANTFTNLAVIDRMRERPQEALAKYRRARDLYYQLGEKRTSEVTINLNMGNIYLDLGEYSTAREFFQRSLEAAQRYGDRKTIGIIYYNFGKIEYHLGRAEKALEYSCQACEIIEQAAQPYYLLESLLFRAEVLVKLKKPQEAKQVLERAVSLARGLGKSEYESQIEKSLEKLNGENAEGR